MKAIYARQSKDKKDSISIETQIDYCRKEVYDEDYEVYQDKGFSGSNTNRPAFKRLLDDIKKQRISQVIIYRLDRMSRSLLDFAKLMELFQKYGVKFLSTQEKFDTTTPMGNAMLSITMVFAQLERETLQCRIKDNYYARGKKGMYLGGKAPFGYDKVETSLDGKKTYKLIKNETDSQIVEAIFNWYVNQGLSISAIGRRLNESNQFNGQKLFYAGNLTRIIRNPIYVSANADIFHYYKSFGCQITNSIEDFQGQNGCFLYGKNKSTSEGRTRANMNEHTLSIGLHEGFIDPDTFLAAQSRINQSKPISRLGTGSKSWISGLIRCGTCGYRMSVKTSVNKDKHTGEVRAEYLYFCCNGVRYGAHKQPLPKHGIVANAIENVVEHQLLQHAGLKKDLMHQFVQTNTREQNQLKIDLEKMNGEIHNVVEAIAQGNTVVQSYMNEKLEALDQQKREIQKRLLELESRNQSENHFSMADLIRQWSTYELPIKKKLAALFIHEITILHEEEGDSIQIKWNYDFSEPAVNL